MSDPSPWSSLAFCWEELFPLRHPRLALALALAPEGGATLDAGCATGSLPRALAARGRLAHGLDLEPAFLAEARRKARDEDVGVRWHEAGLLGMTQAVGVFRFDLITCLGQTLPHLLEEAEWLAWFSQARDLLRPGGHLVIQVVNDAGKPAGHSQDLPLLRGPGGALERRRVMVSATRARFETTFLPTGGLPLRSSTPHLRMTAGRAADLLREAGLDPGGPLADEAGNPFTETSPGWIIQAGRPTPH